MKSSSLLPSRRDRCRLGIAPPSILDKDNLNIADSPWLVAFGEVSCKIGGEGNYIILSG